MKPNTGSELFLANKLQLWLHGNLQGVVAPLIGASPLHVHTHACEHGNRAILYTYFSLMKPKLCPSNALLCKLHFKIISLASEEVDVSLKNARLGVR